MISEKALRGTGRTTRIILDCVNSCLEHAGSWIAIVDHDDTEMGNNSAADHVAAILSHLSIGYARSKNNIFVTPLNYLEETEEGEQS